MSGRYQSLHPTLMVRNMNFASLVTSAGRVHPCRAVEITINAAGFYGRVGRSIGVIRTKDAVTVERLVARQAAMGYPVRWEGTPPAVRDDVIGKLGGNAASANSM
jgi:hypothetical protein